MRKHPTSPAKGCIFCGAEAKLTGEHVFANWLGPYLPKLGSSGHITSKALRALDASTLKIESDKNDLRKGILNRQSPVRNQTLKLVCMPCNTGWMSRLQDQVKPILVPILEGGWPSAISAWERRILAAWATMFTMVVEFADLQTLVTPFDDRERLRLTLQPPVGWSVWVGLHKGPLWTAGFNHFSWSKPKFYWAGQIEPLATTLVAAGKNEMQSTGWVFGPAFFQTTSSAASGYSVDQAAFAARHGIRVVWPSDNLPIDRPTKVMDDIDADNVSSGLLPSYYPRKNIRKAWEVT